jgi:hypothetical protein
MGQLGESSAFGVRQTQAATRELGFEHPILFFEVGDDMLLAPVDPSSDHDDNDLQEMVVMNSLSHMEFWIDESNHRNI